MAKLLTGTRVYGTANVDSVLRVGNTTPANSTSNATGSLVVTGGIGVSGNIYVGGTNAGINGVYTDVLRYAANGLPWVMGSGGGGSSLDQFARDTANNASANTIIIQGVDVGQNAKITIIENTDLSQNVRLNFSNTKMDIIDGVNASQNVRLNFSNTKMDIIDGVNASQNVRLDFSNSRMTIIDGVDATQNTSIANRLALSGASLQTVSGNVVFSNDVTVTGNLIILGNTLSINVSSLEVEDTLIQLGIGNYTTDVLSIGYVGHYNDGTNANAGFIRDAITKEFYAFQGYTPETTGNVININAASFNKANIQGNWFKGNLIATTARVGGLDVNSRLDFSNTKIAIIEGVDVTQNTAIAATDSKMQSGYNVANTADVHSAAAYFHANGAFIKANAAFDQANVTIGVDASQNVRLDFSNTAINATDSKMQSGYNVANTADVHSAAAYFHANGAFIKANAAFDSVNVQIGVDNTQNTRLIAIEGTNDSQNVSISTQNSLITIIHGVDVGQNTAIAATDNKMQSAYDQANTGTVLAQAAFNQANTGALSSGYLANTIIVANSTGFLSNSNAFFTQSNSTIIFGRSAPVVIQNTTSSTSNTTGALVVSGGISTTSNVFIGTTRINTDRTITNYGVTVNALGDGNGSRTIDVTLGNFVTATATGITTWTFSNPVQSPNACGFILELVNGGSATQNWPGTVRWPGGTAPTLTASGVDILVFITDDGGANWRGVASMVDSK
jgi:hypothetical protein